MAKTFYLFSFSFSKRLLQGIKYKQPKSPKQDKATYHLIKNFKES